MLSKTINISPHTQHTSVQGRSISLTSFDLIQKEFENCVSVSVPHFLFWSTNNFSLQFCYFELTPVKSNSLVLSLCRFDFFGLGFHRTIYNSWSEDSRKLNLVCPRWTQ